MVGLGLHLPHFGPLATPEVLTDVVDLAEELGVDALWAGDHVAIPLDVRTPYPYHESGSAAFDAEVPFYDPFALLAFAAGRTSHVSLGFSVLVVPYRHPLVTTKLIATLDALSRGRVIVGAGAGWMAEEFAAMDVPFDERGAITDEYLDVLRRGWRDGIVSSRTAHTGFPEVSVRPRPEQRPGPPIWVGGHSAPAMRRALRIGDGWQATASSADELAGLVSRLRELSGGALPPDFALSSRLHIPRFDPSGAGDRGPDDLRAVVAGYAEAGAGHVVIDLWDRDPRRYLARLEAMIGWLRPDPVP